MSNIFSNSSGSMKRKQIKIKPIQLEKQNAVKQDNLEDENTAIQNKLRLAYEELQQLEQQKVKMLADTKSLIDKEKENWEKDKQIFIKQAHEEGYNDGFAAGKQESLENYQQLLDKANAIIGSATADYHSILEQSDETIVNLSIQVTEKIIKQRLVEEPTAFLPIVKSAIKEIKDQSTLSIYLHPENYEYVVQQKDELLQLVDADTRLQVYINEEMKINSCLIEHPFGKIDASIDTQLKQLRKILLEITGEA